MVPTDSCNGVIWQPVLSCICGEPLVLIAGQAVCGANPQTAVGAGGERSNRITRQIAVALAEVNELIAIEACEPFIGSEPEVAVGGLGDGADGVLRQPLFLRPGGARVLRELFPRIESRGVAGAETHHQRHEYRGQISPEWRPHRMIPV